MKSYSVEELLVLWKRHARGDKLTPEEGKALDDALVRSPELRASIKELRED